MNKKITNKVKAVERIVARIIQEEIQGDKPDYDFCSDMASVAQDLRDIHLAFAGSLSVKREPKKEEPTTEQESESPETNSPLVQVAS
jgi:hypothetical protein